MTSVAYRTCPLCEATCGLEIVHDGEKVGRIRGDREDVFSRGFICPKGSTLGKLDEDPDRLRQPLVKRDGRHEPVSWDEAFALIDDRLTSLLAEHGQDAVGVYLGNPNVHSMSGVLYPRVMLKMLRTRSVFTASTVDQMPKHVSAGLMFGHPDLIPVPDLDRTDYLLILGANPLESNGSLATAPDWPGRLSAIRERGGRVVVVDPRRTRTADYADLHLPIRPGADALLLFALAHVLFEEGVVDLGHLAGHVAGLDEVGGAVGPFSPETVAPACGIDAATIRGLALGLAGADSAAVYGRIGTHTTEFGTLASWMVDVLNVLTGNLDQPGGAMFPRAAHEQPRTRRGFQTGRWASRVNGLPETRGELPVSALSEEILTPGPGQIRAMVVIAGNPLLSTPDSLRLGRALEGLDFMVAIDLYLNETSRLADVVLPGVSPLRRPHYDFAFNQLAVRNVANYSPPLFPLPAGTPDEWEILLRLGAICSGQGASADIAAIDDGVFGLMVGSAVADPRSKVFGRPPEEIYAATDGGQGPVRMLDFLVRTGPYGDGYGADRDGLTLQRLLANPHGIDLGPMQPRLPEDLCTPSGLVELAPGPILADVPRLRAFVDRPGDQGFLLIGRRDLRSNNSWMHNIDVLVSGRERCTLQINPDDAARIGLDAGQLVEVTSAAGSVTAKAEVTPHIMPGVISLPHGWGHDLEGSRLTIASSSPGVNSNRLSTGAVDPLSGNAVLNAIPVELSPV